MYGQDAVQVKNGGGPDGCLPVLIILLAAPLVFFIVGASAAALTSNPGAGVISGLTGAVAVVVVVTRWWVRRTRGYNDGVDADLQEPLVADVRSALNVHVRKNERFAQHREAVVLADRLHAAGSTRVLGAWACSVSVNGAPGALGVVGLGDTAIAIVPDDSLSAARTVWFLDGVHAEREGLDVVVKHGADTARFVMGGDVFAGHVGAMDRAVWKPDPRAEARAKQIVDAVGAAVATAGGSELGKPVQGPLPPDGVRAFSEFVQGLGPEARSLSCGGWAADAVAEIVERDGRWQVAGCHFYLSPGTYAVGATLVLQPRNSRRPEQQS